MSKQIDLSEKLSDFDRQYLLDRNEWRKVQANDEEFGDGSSEPNPEFSPSVPNNLDTDPAHVVNTGPSDDEEQAEEETEGDDVTKKDLKEILDARGVKYKSSANKDELIALVNGVDEDDEDDEDEDES